MSSRLVIVGGAPATGKTKLAHALGTALTVPVITKDDLKEALAEPFATGDLNWSRQLGVAAYGVLYAVAERVLAAGGSLILESNFRRGYEAPLRSLMRLTPTVVIVCRVSDELRRQRFEQRAARGRHRVHIDKTILDEWIADDSQYLIDLGCPRLLVDTTGGFEPELSSIVTFAQSATVARE